MSNMKKHLYKIFSLDPANHAPQTADTTPQGVQVSTYKYKPLQIDRSIRILDLEPATTEDAPLRASLREVSLSDDPDYEAISYAWGAAVFTTSLELPDGTLHITDSLASGLRRFRRPNATRALWADAVCIDQANNAEKSRQVAQMGSVYRNATRCLIWLGYPNGSEAAAANFMAAYATLAATRDRYGVDVSPAGDVVGGWTAGIPDDGPVREALQRVPVDFDWNGADEFYSAPWFQRRWCLQEIVLAPDAEVYYGVHRITWQDFMIAAHIAWRSVNKTKTANLRMPHNFFQTVYLADARLLFRGGARLVTFLNHFPSFICSDDRDYVYSLLGLRASQDVDIWPDYTKPTVQVFKQTIRKMYLKDSLESIKMLSHAGLVQRYPPAKNRVHGNTVHPQIPALDEVFRDLPSWAPDWRIRDPIAPFSKGHGPRYFEASSNFHPHVKPNEDGHLSIVGHVLGRVTSCKDLGPQTEMYYNEHRDKLLGWKAWFDEQCTHTKPIPREEDPLCVFLRIITADQNTTAMSTMLRRVLSMDELITLWMQFATTPYHDQSSTEKFETDGSAPRVAGTAHSPTDFISQYSDLYNFRLALRRLLDDRLIFASSNGLFGLAPAVAREGDVVVVFPGLEAPFLVRPSPDSQHFYLIGDCYAHGIMYGQLQPLLEKSQEWTWCTLK